jgi:glycosyltransferase involved in cell wall biosynthesis
LISVLILTRNEAQNLPACIASVAWSDDIHVLDSLSTDGTQAIAAAAGAHVTERPFDNWSSHQNWALQNLPFKYPWVFYLDADERVTPALRDAVLQAVAAPGHHVAFRVQRRDFIFGTWLKHVQTSPFYMRLFRPEAMRYERLVNPVSIPSGPVGQVTGYLDHFPFSKGIDHWVKRHNQYSHLEAEQTVANRRNHAKFSVWAACFEKDFHRRRFHQKELFYRLPARPQLRFLYLYVFRLGFLDGAAGYTYARLQSFYEYLIVAKTKELERKTAPAPEFPES